MLHCVEIGQLNRVIISYATFSALTSLHTNMVPKNMSIQVIFKGIVLLHY